MDGKAGLSLIYSAVFFSHNTLSVSRISVNAFVYYQCNLTGKMS